jgi:hypothetical protein
MIRQRYRLYAAEDQATKADRCWFGSAEAAQMWLDRAIRKKWWRKACQIRHIKLVYPYAGGMSGATLEGAVLTICVRPESLSTTTLIHELAHGLAWVPGHDSEKDHGPRYAGALIACYRHFDCAAAAVVVENAFDEAGVKYEEFT